MTKVTINRNGYTSQVFQIVSENYSKKPENQFDQDEEKIIYALNPNNL